MFNTRKNFHYFCKHCGVRAFGVGTETPMEKMYGVNLGCLEGVTEKDLARVLIIYVDSQSDRFAPPEHFTHLCASLQWVECALIDFDCPIILAEHEGIQPSEFAAPFEDTMKREVIRVEPLSTYLENWKAPTSAVTRSGDTIYVSGFPPFDPETGQVIDAPIERQTEIVLDQMKLCLETAGSSLANVLKCNVYCTSVDKFAAVNAVYARYFPKDPPARIFVCVPAWPGRFDIEIDCVAAV